VGSGQKRDEDSRKRTLTQVTTVINHGEGEMEGGAVGSRSGADVHDLDIQLLQCISGLSRISGRYD
jgi:hypothetical protein